MPVNFNPVNFNLTPSTTRLDTTDALNFFNALPQPTTNAISAISTGLDAAQQNQARSQQAQLQQAQANRQAQIDGFKIASESAKLARETENDQVRGSISQLIEDQNFDAAVQVFQSRGFSLPSSDKASISSTLFAKTGNPDLLSVAGQARQVQRNERAADAGLRLNELDPFAKTFLGSSVNDISNVRLDDSNENILITDREGGRRSVPFASIPTNQRQNVIDLATATFDMREASDFNNLQKNRVNLQSQLETARKSASSRGIEPSEKQELENRIVSLSSEIRELDAQLGGVSQVKQIQDQFAGSLIPDQDLGFDFNPELDGAFTLTPNKRIEVLNSFSISDGELSTIEDRLVGGIKLKNGDLLPSFSTAKRFDPTLTYNEFIESSLSRLRRGSDA